MIDLEAIRWNHDNLVPVIVQAGDGRVLMLAYANRLALEKTIETGLMHFWSRSRQALWQKGETSGHKQQVISLALDCDNDTVLAQVEQTGPACHTGTSTCFGEVQPPVLSQLWSIFEQRQTDQTKNSYVNKLLGEPRRLRQKIGEEGVEVALAEGKEELIFEAGDLIFHLSVLLFYHGLKWQDVERELQKRRK